MDVIIIIITIIITLNRSKNRRVALVRSWQRVFNAGMKHTKELKPIYYVYTLTYVQ